MDFYMNYHIDPMVNTTTDDIENEVHTSTFIPVK